GQVQDFSFVFGNFQPVSISGYKWNDLNGNGAWDAGEPGLNGWAITLTDSAGNPVKDVNGATVNPVTTANGGSPAHDGFYQFTNLKPGTYHVIETLQSNWTESFPTATKPSGATTFSQTQGSNTVYGYEITLTSGQAANGSFGTATAEDFGNFTTPSVTITKQAVDASGNNLGNPATINLGDTAYFKITVSNTGGGPAFNVNLSDNLPRDPEGTGTGILTWVIASFTSGAANNPALGSQTGSHAGDPTVPLTWNIGTLNGGASFSVTVSADTTPLENIHGIDLGAALPTNLFQLDGDAQYTTNPSSTFAAAKDDWDSVLGFTNPVTTPNATPNTAPYPQGSAKPTSQAFVPDPVNSQTDNIFTTGGSKDTLDTTQWQWTTGTPPDKDDLAHAYSAVYEVPSTKTSGVEDQVLFFGADRYANNGDSNIGFWFFREPIGPQSNGTFGPGKHVAGPLDPNTRDATHPPGDVFIVSSFTQGGAIGTIQVYEWVGFDSKGKGLGDDQTVWNSGPKPAGFKADGPLQLRFSGAPNPSSGLFAIINNAANDPPTGTVTSPWAYTPKFGTAGTLPTGSFFEGGINLSSFGLAGCFTSFIAETRTSQTTNAQLKDFVAGNIATCKLVNSATVTWSSPLVQNGATQTATAGPVEIDIAGTGVSPMTAAGSVPGSGTSSTPLQDAQLQLYVQQAIARWQAAGLTGAPLNQLLSTPVHVANLGGATLGVESAAGITIDDDAAGYGWYLDPTPGDDSEFVLAGDQGEQGRMDLLTVVLHEMGHTVGLSDLYDAGSSQDLMYEFLGTGQRRTPSAADVAQVLGTMQQAPSAGITTAPAGSVPPAADPAALSSLASALTAAPLGAIPLAPPRLDAASSVPASATTLPLGGTALPLMPSPWGAASLSSSGAVDSVFAAYAVKPLDDPLGIVQI
ncbi:MAG TPA: SdrD B-like domain-containing protein, partial [Gemmataceae bacterium]|nr:SdrD B-like domain-containing protein [Gemmataceae bacterium]